MKFKLNLKSIKEVHIVIENYLVKKHSCIRVYVIKR